MVPRGEGLECPLIGRVAITRPVNDEERAELIKRFEAVGVSMVQAHLASRAYSEIVDSPAAADVRAFAKKWVEAELDRGQRRRILNDNRLRRGTIVAIVAAFFGIVGSSPIWWPWLRDFFSNS